MESIVSVPSTTLEIKSDRKLINDPGIIHFCISPTFFMVDTGGESTWRSLALPSIFTRVLN
ncbi:hypothetical protein ACXYUI_27750, partial [Klebsiella pneumoniae]